jgi:heme exporter protein A
MSAPPLLDVRAVSKSYGGRPVIRDVSLSVAAGRVVALLGANGAGKSTLLRIAAGVVHPERGEVRIDGRRADDAAARRLVGLAGHASFLYGYLTVEENLDLYARLYRLRGDRVAASLAVFNLRPHGRTRVRELSRGLVQRVSLARAILHDPAVLLLDEPLTGLDTEAAAALRSLIARLRADGRAVVMATHVPAEARELADDAVVLAAGRLAMREAAAALDPDRIASAYQTA